MISGTSAYDREEYDVRGRGAGRYPQHKDQVFYRLPFLYLTSDRDRAREAWESAQVFFTCAFECLPGMNALEPYEGSGMQTAQYDLPLSTADRVYIEIALDKSDLWLRLSFSDVRSDEAKAFLERADTCFLSMNRSLYKYVWRDDGMHAYPKRGSRWEYELKGYLGLDAGSISINVAFVDESGIVLETDYTLTEGDLINNIKKSLSRLSERLPANVKIAGSGVTGSGHEISKAMMNADVYETELDAHAEAAIHIVPGVQVIFDIGGQDSKVMYIQDGMLDEAGMNKKCGAGTGAFLDAQAARLGIPIEEFGEISMKAKKPYGFSSMCTVFVGRDLIAEQTKGNTKENIIAGLHKSLAMNFYATLGINKKTVKTPIVFQGGVAANRGVKRALEQCLEESRGENVEIIVPLFHNVMGAIGMALFARNGVAGKTGFRGFEHIGKIRSEFSECELRGVCCDRERACDLVKLSMDGEPIETLYTCVDYQEKSFDGAIRRVQQDMAELEV